MDTHEKLSGYVLNLIEYNDRMHFLNVFTETGKHTIMIQKKWLNKPDFLSTSGAPCMVQWLCKKTNETNMSYRRWNQNIPILTYGQRRII